MGEDTMDGRNRAKGEVGGATRAEGEVGAANDGTWGTAERRKDGTWGTWGMTEGRGEAEGRDAPVMASRQRRSNPAAILRNLDPTPNETSLPGFDLAGPPDFCTDTGLARDLDPGACSPAQVLLLGSLRGAVSRKEGGRAHYRLSHLRAAELRVAPRRQARAGRLGCQLAAAG